MDVIANDGNIDNSGIISGHQKANLNSSKAVTNAGLINGGTLNVVARDGNIDTSGEIYAKDSLAIISSKAITNKGKILGNVVDVMAKDGDINNRGCVQGKKSIKADSSKDITNADCGHGTSHSMATRHDETMYAPRKRILNLIRIQQRLERINTKK